MKPFKTIKLLLSTLLLFVLSFNVYADNTNAEILDDSLQMQKHLNILGYKIITPDSDGNILAVNNNNDILSLMKEPISGGFIIFTPYTLKNNIKKDIKFYKLLEKINNNDLIKAKVSDNFLVISMVSLHKYNKNDFTQIVNRFNDITSWILKSYGKEISEYLK